MNTNDGKGILSLLFSTGRASDINRWTGQEISPPERGHLSITCNWKRIGKRRTTRGDTVRIYTASTGLHRIEGRVTDTAHGYSVELSALAILAERGKEPEPTDTLTSRFSEE